MSKYLFRRKGEYIGELICKNNSQAFEMANNFGATFIRNIDNRDAFGKCSLCGEWEKVDKLTNGFCGDCAYKQEIQIFIDYMEKSMENALEEDTKGNEDAYVRFFQEPIRISFNGASLELTISPCEWEYVIHCLEKIKEEYPW
jgi:hypothetical protein